MQPYPPEYDDQEICAVCWRNADDCDCPECDKCDGLKGSPDCYNDGHLPPRKDSVQAFLDYIGVGNDLESTLHACDKYNPTHTFLEVGDGVIYYWSKPFPKPAPWVRIKRIGRGGIAWDGSDWEWTGFCEAGDWEAYEALAQEFEDALEEHEALMDEHE